MFINWLFSNKPRAGDWVKTLKMYAIYLTRGACEQKIKKEIKHYSTYRFWRIVFEFRHWQKKSPNKQKLKIKKHGSPTVHRAVQPRLITLNSSAFKTRAASKREPGASCWCLARDTPNEWWECACAERGQTHLGRKWQQERSAAFALLRKCKASQLSI